MTKKDYETLATIISETRRSVQSDLIGGEGAMNVLVAKLATRLGQENPRFNVGRFFDATR